MTLRGLIGWALGCWLLAASSLAQAPPAGQGAGSQDGADRPAAAEPGETAPGEDGDAGDTQTVDGAATPKRSVLSEFQRVMRTRQSHLNENDEGGAGIGGTVAVLAVAYVAIVLAVLAFWRRARDPKVWRLRTEPVQGEGRWLTHLAYAIRRKSDVEVTLTMAKVEPAGCGVQLAYLVDDEIKGRLSEGSEGKVSFAALKPKSFWQSDQRDSFAIGFELIQPRDRKISLHLDLRTDFRIGKKRGLAGISQELLVFEPSFLARNRDLMADDASAAFSSGQHRLDPGGGLGNLLDDTGGLGGVAPVASPGAPTTTSASQIEQLRSQQGELEQRLHLLEARFLSESAPLEDVEHRLRVLETKLDAMPERTAGTSQETEQRLQQLESQVLTGAMQPADEASTELRQEMRAAEERAAKALRENLQVVVKNMKGLRGELTQLNTAVNDMMQRFVNSERRVAEIARRLPPDADA